MGFFSDLFNIGKDVWDSNKEEITNEVGGRIQGRFQTDHIGAQNHVVQVEFPEVLADFDSGRISLSEATQRIQSIVDGFTRYAYQYGTRGRNGAADIQGLGAQLIRDMRARASTVGGTVGSAGNWLADNSLWVMGGVAVGAYLLAGRRRGRRRR